MPRAQRDNFRLERDKVQTRWHGKAILNGNKAAKNKSSSKGTRTATKAVKNI